MKTFIALALFLVMVGCSRNQLPATDFPIGETPSIAVSDGNDAHGGDAHVAEFKITGRKVCQWLSENPSPISSEQFCQTLKEVDVESTKEKILVKEVKKDARNWPIPKKVEFNENDWDRLHQEHLRWAIVFHEIYSVMHPHGDDDYSATEKIILAAFPGVLAKGSYFLGRAPVCESQAFISEVGIEPQFIGFGVEVVPSSASPEKIDVQFLVRSAEGEERKNVVKSLQCHYGTFPSETFLCTNPSGHLFQMIREEDRASIRIRSPLVSARLARNRAVPVEQRLRGTTVLSLEQWVQILNGSLPFHLDDLRRVALENYERSGGSALPELVLSFPNTDCRWKSRD